MPSKAQNWHDLSHEQYFSKYRFLDICRCAYNKQAKQIEWMKSVFESAFKQGNWTVQREDFY